MAATSATGAPAFRAATPAVWAELDALRAAILTEWEDAMHSVRLATDGCERAPEDDEWGTLWECAVERAASVLRIGEAAGVVFPMPRRKAERNAVEVMREKIAAADAAARRRQGAETK